MNNTIKKIKTLHTLAEIVANHKAHGAIIVHCHGVFDLLHIGHIRYFEQAKKAGDILVVTLTQDKHVNKGPHRPVFTETLRAEAIAALDCVDYVAINDWPMAVETIKLLQPSFYVKGSDYKDATKDYSGGILLEKEAIESVGGELFFTDDITFSSSKLINRHLPVFPKEVNDYLIDFSLRYPSQQVLKYLKQIEKLKVLIIGETIIDEYVYCNSIGKAGKEPVLVAKYLNREKFAGGVLAVANHAAAFCNNVSLLSFLGEQESHQDFISDQLNAQIDTHFLFISDAPTIVKRRYVETYPFQKLFELYVMRDGEDSEADSRKLCNVLEEMLPNYDLVIVTDYGHGMLSAEAVEILCDQAKFLAVNTQLNAGNRGFNTISKYPRLDYISISENELRMEARDQKRDIHELVLDISSKLSCDKIMITQGQKGCVCYSRNDGFFEIPALSIRVVDRVGAGDTVFAVTSLCAVTDVPMEVIGFIGNTVGAEAVATVGNKKSLDKIQLFKHIETLLK